FGLVRLEDVLRLVDKCPDEIELVFTGRYAKPEVLERADLISEVKCIRHPIEKGLVGRVGIDH
ncbi:MAG: cob(I)yrinic acid a,c-diamide adenosyltransferase, partial [candidate division WOR-3 bacterium]